jgi:hypothetical protein
MINMSDTSSLEKLLKEIESNQRKTNVILENLVNILSVGIDLASGESVLNKDFLDNEIHEGIFTD